MCAGLSVEASAIRDPLPHQRQTGTIWAPAQRSDLPARAQDPERPASCQDMRGIGQCPACDAQGQGVGLRSAQPEQLT